MNNYQEESKLLFKLLRTKAFRFITIKYNHYSLVEQLKEDLKENFPNRKSTEIDATKTDYRNLVDSYYELESGFFFIENFDKLLENPEIYPALNQRRDKLAKYPIAMIAFISPSAPKLYARELMEKMPDLWSFRSLMLELEKDIQPQETQTQFSNNQKDTISISSLGGNTIAEKQQEIKRLEKLLADTPNDIPLKEVILSQLATLYRDIGEYERSNEIIDKLLKNNKDEQFKLNLLIEKGDNYITSGKLENAIIPFEKSLKISIKIKDKEREAIALQRLGDVYQELGNLQLALDCFKKQNEIFEQYQRDFPNDSMFKYGLAISYQFSGKLYQKLGNLRVALDFFEKQKKLFEYIYDEFPENINFENGLAVSYQLLGYVHQELGNLNLALNFFEKQNELTERLQKKFPNNINFKNGLAISYQFLGNTHQKLGNTELALKLFEERHKIAKELHKEFPNNVNFKNGLAISCQNIGIINRELGNLTIALEFFKKQNNLFKQLYNDFPTNVNFKNGLAISYQFLGNINRKIGKLELALSFLKKQSILSEQLYKEFPNDVNLKNGLAISYINLHFIYSDLQQKNESKIYLEKAAKLFEELAKDFPSHPAFLNYYKDSSRRLKEVENQ
jgi:tetratricopeptide (TPR) repeat protein